MESRSSQKSIEVIMTAIDEAVREGSLQSRIKKEKEEFINRFLSAEKALDNYLDLVKKRDEKEGIVKTKSKEKIKKEKEELRDEIAKSTNVSPAAVDKFLQKVADADIILFDNKGKLFDFYLTKFNFYLLKNGKKDEQYDIAQRFMDGFVDYASHPKFISVGGKNLLGKTVKNVNSELQKLKPERLNINDLEEKFNRETPFLQGLYSNLYNIAQTDRMHFYFMRIMPALNEFRIELEKVKNSDDKVQSKLIEEMAAKYKIDKKLFEEYRRFLMSYSTVFNDKSAELAAPGSKHKYIYHKNYASKFLQIMLPRMVEVQYKDLKYKEQIDKTEEIKKDILNHFNDLVKQENKIAGKKEIQFSDIADELGNQYDAAHHYQPGNFPDKDSYFLYDKHKKAFIADKIMAASEETLKLFYPEIGKSVLSYKDKTKALKDKYLKAKQEFDSYYESKFPGKRKPIEDVIKEIMPQYIPPYMRGLPETLDSLLTHKPKKEDEKMFDVLKKYKQLVQPLKKEYKKAHDKIIHELNSTYNRNNLPIENFKNLVQTIDELEFKFANDKMAYAQGFFNKIVGSITKYDPNLKNAEKHKEKVYDLFKNVELIAKLNFASEIHEFSTLGAPPSPLPQEPVQQAASPISEPVSAKSEVAKEAPLKKATEAPSKTHSTSSQLLAHLKNRYDNEIVPQYTLNESQQLFLTERKHEFVNDLISDSIEKEIEKSPLNKDLKKFKQTLQNFTLKVRQEREKFSQLYSMETFGPNRLDIPTLIDDLYNRYVPKELQHSKLSRLDTLLSLIRNKQITASDVIDNDLLGIIEAYGSGFYPALMARDRYYQSFPNYLIKSYGENNKGLAKNYKKLVKDFSHMVLNLSDRDNTEEEQQFYLDVILPDIISCDPAIKDEKQLAEKVDKVTTQLKKQIETTFTDKISDEQLINQLGLSKLEETTAEVSSVAKETAPKVSPPPLQPMVEIRNADDIFNLPNPEAKNILKPSKLDQPVLDTKHADDALFDELAAMKGSNISNPQEELEKLTSETPLRDTNNDPQYSESLNRVKQVMKDVEKFNLQEVNSVGQVSAEEGQYPKIQFANKSLEKAQAEKVDQSILEASERAKIENEKSIEAAEKRLQEIEQSQPNVILESTQATTQVPLEAKEQKEEVKLDENVVEQSQAKEEIQETIVPPTAEPGIKRSSSPTLKSTSGFFSPRKEPEMLNEFQPGELRFIDLDKFKKMIEDKSFDDKVNELKSASRKALKDGLEKLQKQPSDMKAKIESVLETLEQAEKPQPVSTPKKGGPIADKG